MTTQEIYPVRVKHADGSDVDLEMFRGKVLLVVNTASRCGFTSQYAGLQALQEAYEARGFSVLAFPCNQFGAQEPGSDQEIKTFCEKKYAVTFPVFSKIEVNGEGTHPLYQKLKEEKPGLLGSETIKWNFTKFLVNREGVPVERFAPTTKPEDIRPAIEALL